MQPITQLSLPRMMMEDPKFSDDPCIEFTVARRHHYLSCQELIRLRPATVPRLLNDLVYRDVLFPKDTMLFFPVGVAPARLDVQ
jgi:hypothetical protein